MVATGGRLVKILGFLLLILADQLESFGMATGFGTLSIKKYPQKFEKPSNIYKNAKIL